MRIKIDLLPGRGYISQALYRDATTKKQVDAILTNFKNDLAAYRITIDNGTIIERKGHRWYKR